MHGISCLVLVTLGCLLRTNIAEDCWIGNIVRACFLHQPSIDCEEFNLRTHYQLLYKEKNIYNGSNWSSKCVSCQIERTGSDVGVTCSFPALSLIDEDNYIAYRGLIFVYISINPNQNNVELSFEQEVDGNSILTSVSGVRTVEGIPVGPFVADATSRPIHLRRFRCVDQFGQRCDVMIHQRRPFAFIHYVQEAL